MKHKLAVFLVAGLWLLLAAAAWILPSEEISISERRPLEQFPELSRSSLLKGDFMEDFESYCLDQFPLREEFRTLKSLFHYYILNHSDNNGIYLALGMAVQQEYPLDQGSIAHAADRFTAVYEKYLSESNVYFALVPDKGQYLAKESGQLHLDYAAMSGLLQERLPWAVHVDLFDSLQAQDYYATDTHWRQERLLTAAQKLCDAMGVQAPVETDYRMRAVDRPFYGVYYGQAALPMDPDTIYIMESDLFNGCRVYDYETGKTGSVYDMDKLSSRDLYDVFLSGAKSLLTIENPAASTDRELIVFRDSFGSSLVPLLVQGYRSITLVDIRYIHSSMLAQYVDFHGQDVLFLYSTLVLNNSETIK